MEKPGLADVRVRAGGEAGLGGAGELLTGSEPVRGEGAVSFWKESRIRPLGGGVEAERQRGGC